jgi:glutamate-5-semialdehyde dehydrogenase
MVSNALDPALAAAALPEGAVSLVDSPARAAGWAMFSDTRLALAVARGSGAAVAQLGAVARQAGVPVSLHGTGGAWVVAAPGCAPDDLALVTYHSLDRKVCNTLNTMCIPARRAAELVPAFLEGLERAAARRGANPKLHIIAGQDEHIPADWFDPVEVSRAQGPVIEPRTEEINVPDLAREWEWEDSPEVTLAIVETIAEAAALFNRWSPRFVASLIGGTGDEQEEFFETVDAPFVGNGFTRWVDGQYALDRPELGLSNWQFGRLFGRGGVLSGDSVFTVRTRVYQDDLDIGR